MTRSERDHVLVGLIGEGIGRSLAPLLHQREADRQGIRLLYTTIDSQPLALSGKDLPALLRWARTLGYRGLNITYPFKQEIITHLDELSPQAQAIGSVNTVVFEPGGARGYNTDWSGFRHGFEREFADVARQRVVQLGAGGAGSAVAHAMLDLGAEHLTVIDLNPDKAKQLTATLTPAFGPHRISAGTMADLAALLAGAQGLINTTPIGMAHHPGTPIAESLLRSDLWVADIVYRPIDTELLRAAKAAGARTLNGGSMNAFQAVEAFEHFTGTAADADAMLADLAELLTLDL